MHNEYFIQMYVNGVNLSLTGVSLKNNTPSLAYVPMECASDLIDFGFLSILRLKALLERLVFDSVAVDVAGVLCTMKVTLASISPRSLAGFLESGLFRSVYHLVGE